MTVGANKNCVLELTTYNYLIDEISYFFPNWSLFDTEYHVIVLLWYKFSQIQTGYSIDLSTKWLSRQEAAEFCLPHAVWNPSTYLVIWEGLLSQINYKTLVYMKSFKKLSHHNVHVFGFHCIFCILPQTTFLQLFFWPLYK